MEEKFDEIHTPAEQPNTEPVAEAEASLTETAEAAEAQAEPVCEPSAEGEPHDDEAPAQADEAQTEEPAETEEAALPPVQIEPVWGAPVQERRRLGLAGFFAIFGSVVGLCVILLIALLLMGENGIRFSQNVTYERVVYVREDGTIVGKYTPGEVVDTLSESTVTVIVKGASVSGFGSGFIYSADGYIITNHHVIEVDGDVQVMLSSGKVYDAVVVGSNKAADVAVLKINSDVALKPVTIGNSDMVLVGEEVVAIGTPVELDYHGTATFGRISAASRIVTFTDSSGNVTKRMYVLQTDTSVNPGNSGGPLVNMDGEVVGVVVMKLMGSSQEHYEGLGFALPINGVVEIADQIIAKGSFSGTNPIAKGRLLIGVMGLPVVDGYWYNMNSDGTYEVSMTEVEGYVQMPASGIYVASVSAGGGSVGKVQAGDIIIKADGLRVIAMEDLVGTVNRRESGYGVTLTVLRDGQEIDVVVNLNEEPLQ